jgi:chromosome segregation ATPase
MSFLKQLLNPFIEFDENNKPVPQKDIPPVQPVLQQEAASTHPLITENKNDIISPGDPQAVQSGAGSDENQELPLPEHVAYFEKLIDKANNENPLFSGPDYKEFVDTKIDIDDITDENLKYKTAFNILKSSGLDKNKLISTALEYANLIGKDLNAFQSAHAQLYKKELQEKEKVLKNKTEELQELSRRIQHLKTDINKISGEITVSKQRLDTIKNSFLLAGENKQKEIQNELDKISKYFD